MNSRELEICLAGYEAVYSAERANLPHLIGH